MLKDILLENLDILQFLDDNGHKVRKIGGATEYLLDKCPNCHKEFHCGIQVSKKRYACYKCRQGGDFIKLIGKILNKDYFEVIDLLKEGLDEKHCDIRFIGNMLQELKINTPKTPKPIELPEGYISLYNKRIPYLDTGRKFPIPQDQINYYRMGVCLTGRYKDRVIVCDVNENQEIIYWIARDISGLVKKSEKVLNPVFKEGSTGSGEILFNFSLAKQYQTVIIVEGVFDSIYVGNNCVASYSKGLKYNHLYLLISGGFEEVTLLYDSDVADIELNKSGMLLSQFFKTKICKLPDGDPDEWPKEDLKKFINNAPIFTGSQVSVIDEGLLV